MGTLRVVMAKRSVWPGLYREGQRWVWASGNRPRKQKKKKNTAFGQTHREGTSVLLDAVAS